MALLPQTQAVLAEISANRQHEIGLHSALQVRAGVPGLDVGEMQFNPALHSPADINPLSVWGLVMGVPHVQLSVPHESLETRIIVQHEAGHEDPRFSYLKQRMAALLLESFEDSKLSVTDRVRTYHIGDVEDDLLEMGTELIPVRNNPEAAAKTVAELTQEGLSFVISDFNHLPLTELGKGNFPATVGVKLTHPSELPLKPGKGTVPLGGKRELDLGNPKQLAAYNASIEKLQAERVERLESVGIAVAQVVFDHTLESTYGLDVAAADKAIAQATAHVAHL